jgi:hypothetical protein
MMMMRALVAVGLVFGTGCAVGGDGSEQDVTSELNKNSCHKGDPDYRYIGTSKRACQAIRFTCTEGTPFFDNCGCGCYVDSCPIIDCAAPPDGCHYDGAVFSPCEAQTCGTLVCDGSNL